VRTTAEKDSLTSIGLSYAGGAATAIGSSFVAEKTGLSKTTIALGEAALGGYMALTSKSATWKRVGAGMGVAGAVLAVLDWKQERDDKKHGATQPQQIGAGERRQARGEDRDALQEAVRAEVRQQIGDNNRELVDLMRREMRNAGDGEPVERDAAGDDWRDSNGEERDAGGDDWRDAGDDWRDAV
jgi:hypothetical protein